ncbi:MAG TPA: DUF222 domain-containing protein, partial [Mycobacterium sp.]|nr:DUF222 domain-containing protein [Mycobacterium sp.]
AQLRCECESPQCSATQRPSGSPQVVIHVLAEQASVDACADTPGYLVGHGPLPAATVQDLAADAKIKPLPIPDPATASEPGYRPSAALAEFARARDLTCRFPGCDRPAQCCDLDHTVPWPVGPTHPSNLKLYCRTHHLLKTFWVGKGGWAEKQFADGTITWTAPSGRTYTTTPGGSLFFPQLATPTGELRLPHGTQPSEGRGLMMPRRKQTRQREHDERIAAERALNEQLIRRQQWLFAELEKHRQARAANDPPPF